MLDKSENSFIVCPASAPMTSAITWKHSLKSTCACSSFKQVPCSVRSTASRHAASMALPVLHTGADLECPDFRRSNSRCHVQESAQLQRNTKLFSYTLISTATLEHGSQRCKSLCPFSDSQEPLMQCNVNMPGLSDPGFKPVVWHVKPCGPCSSAMCRITSRKCKVRY